MTSNIPAVIPSPQARGTLKEGFDQMAHLLGATLGPTQGVIFHTTALKTAPELLTDAATIARRVTALPDRAQDVGAMLLRSLAWRVQQRVGDGCATTAVLAQAILEQGHRFVAAGANPVRVQAGMQAATQRAVEILQQLSKPAARQGDLASVAFTATDEAELSLAIGEMSFRLGEHAHITVEEYMASYLDQEYIDGGQWKAKLISPHLVTAPGGKATTNECHVVLFNGNLTQAEDVLPLVKVLSQSERKNLLLVAQKIDGQAANTLTATYAQNRERLNLQFVLVNLVQVGEKALRDLQDLALLTGAKLFDPQAGETLRSIQPAEMGFAPYAEVVEEALVVSHGAGDPAARQAQIKSLQTYLDALPFDDNQRAEVELRIGRIAGKMGILKIGAGTHNEREVLRQKAEKGLRAVRAAQQGGLVPGGGTAFLHCIPALEKLECADEEMRMGVVAVARALRRPFEQLLANARVEHSARWAHEILQSEPGLVFDVEEKVICPVDEVGLFDPTRALVASLETASSGAQMALSTEVIILKRNPRISYQP